MAFLGKPEEAVKCFDGARNDYTGFYIESRLHFRCHTFKQHILDKPKSSLWVIKVLIFFQNYILSWKRDTADWIILQLNKTILRIQIIRFIKTKIRFFITEISSGSSNIQEFRHLLQLGLSERFSSSLFPSHLYSFFC